MTEDEPGQDPGPPEDARLTSLNRRLKQAQAKDAVRTGRTMHAMPKGRTQGARVLSVLIGYPVGGAAIGWAIDQWAGTRWVAVTMLFLGFVAAMWAIWQISKQPPS